MNKNQGHGDGVGDKKILPPPSVLGESKETPNSSPDNLLQLLSKDDNIEEATDAEVITAHGLLHVFWDQGKGGLSQEEILEFHYQLVKQLSDRNLDNTKFGGTLDDDCKSCQTQSKNTKPEEIHTEACQTNVTINKLNCKVLSIEGAKVVEVWGIAHAAGNWKGTEYLADEIKKGMSTMLNKRIHYEHLDDTSKQVQGFVTSIEWDKKVNGFRAWGLVFDPKFVEFIENGGIEELAKEGKKLGFSVTVYTTDEDVDNKRTAFDYLYDELTITLTPACKVCDVEGGTVHTLSEGCEDKLGGNLMPEKEQQTKAEESATEASKGKKLSEETTGAPEGKSEGNSEEVTTDSDESTKKENVDVAAHEALLKEKTDAVIAIATKIQNGAATMTPEELQAEVRKLDSISWKISGDADVVNASSLSEDGSEEEEGTTEEELQTTAKEHLEAALVAVRDEGGNPEVEKMIQGVIDILGPDTPPTTEESEETLSKGENSDSGKPTTLSEQDQGKKANPEMEQMKKTLSDKETELTKLRKELSSKEVNESLEQLLGTGKILPTQKEPLSKIMLSMNGDERAGLVKVLKTGIQVPVGQETSQALSSEESGDGEKEASPRRIT